MKTQQFLFLSIILGFQTLVFGQNGILQKAEHLLDEGQYDKTLALLSTKEEAYTVNAKYHYVMGRAYIDKLNATDNFFKKGSIASKAKKALLKAIALQPSHVDARILLSNYYMNAPVIAGGSTSKAKKQALEVIRYDSVKGHALLASIHLNNEDYKEALTQYKKILQLDPKNEKVWYWISNVYFEMEAYDKAFQYSLASIKEVPNYLVGHYQYAKVASVSKKNIPTAITYIEYFIQHSPADGQPKKHWAYYRLALLKQHEGDTEASQAALKKALQLKSDFKPAKKLLQ
ncbi:tetratricopeptide repeat protein [Spongiimicrobium salis]|uniref:tetratricopeptide repeat protein n=1 Tax=Spongiimicrobium salis TaxID=1667022 RepID=UPI00374CFE98